jgi:hypothetical protein
VSEKSLETYLNDHLGGATLGRDLAFQIRDRAEEAPLEPVMSWVALEIDEDRETLLRIMEALGATQNPVKQVTGWVAEKASRVKFSGLTGEMDDYGLFMAIEALRLGVAGKRCMWVVLSRLAPAERRLARFDLDSLAGRASNQENALEEQRRILGARVLTPRPATA